MKTRYSLPVLITFLLIFLSGCVSDLTSPETETHNQIRKNQNKKVQVCHLTGTGEYILLEISTNALEAHLSHGDKLLDEDGDGFTSFDACFGSMDDCNDNDPSVYPGAEEICGDGVDNNCNGEIDEGCEAPSTADYFQGFENDKSGWIEGGGIFGTINISPSGTNGINAFTGNYFGLFKGTITGPYSTFDGVKTEWTGPWTAEVAVYLDPQWQTGEGFDFTVTASNTNGNPLRDFVFHVAKDQSTGKLLVGFSQSPGFSPKQDLENSINYEITTGGWYTLQHYFYDNGGLLACDLNLIDGNGNVLLTKTFSNPGDQFSKNVVGGNYRSWFTNIVVSGGLAVDNHSLVRN